eukprot:CAMPEP_0117428082 /NCGR_PEP_ID=MMETSP0758-20121206/7871_1 /TAXON_ID=63605 /ORGANISM="Percolomonas cosmopolitus, Strain AE-1 (ATCC 50343)" /LENGTH=498 /DNA_ID=CAMNT_0005214245 /DNA_START=788 /DNA_END=2281 /DNA_ORIENTATION=-
MYHKIYEWVNTADNTNTILVLDEIGTITEASFKDKNFSFGTNLERTYYLWGVMFPYQMIKGLTLAMIGRSTKFSILGYRRERSPSRLKQIFLDNFNIEDIKKLICYYQKGNQLNELELNKLAREIQLKGAGIPRLSVELADGEEPVLENHSEEFKGLYEHFNKRPFFIEDETIPLEKVKSLLNDKQKTDVRFENLKIRTYELLSNLGIPFSRVEDSIIMRADVPLLYLGPKPYDLYKTRLEYSGHQYMEILTGLELADKVLNSDNYKFLTKSSFDIPEYEIPVEINNEFTTKKTFGVDDGKKLMTHLNTIPLNTAEIIKIDLPNVSFADELLFIPYENENGERCYYMIGVQDKYYMNSEIKGKQIIEEFNKIAKLISFGYDNIKCIALLLCASKQEFNYNFLKKHDKIGYQLILEEAIHAKYKNLNCDHLKKVTNDNFEAFLLTRPYLTNFYNQERIDILMIQDKSIKEGYDIIKEHVASTKRMKKKKKWKNKKKKKW